jgi:hypothetical protein
MGCNIMKRQNDLITFIQQYLNGDLKAWKSMHVSPPDQDRTWQRSIHAEQVQIYLDALDAPLERNARTVERIVRSLKSWREKGVNKTDASKRTAKANPPRALGPDHPPQLAEFILFLIPKRSREYLIGDLEEEYRTKMLPEFGSFRANILYWEQTMVAIICYLWPVLKRLLGLVAVWKLIGR